MEDVIFTNPRPNASSPFARPAGAGYRRVTGRRAFVSRAYSDRRLQKRVAHSGQWGLRIRTGFVLTHPDAAAAAYT